MDLKNVIVEEETEESSSIIQNGNDKPYWSNGKRDQYRIIPLVGLSRSKEFKRTVRGR